MQAPRTNSSNSPPKRAVYSIHTKEMPPAYLPNLSLVPLVDSNFATLHSSPSLITVIPGTTRLVYLPLTTVIYRPQGAGLSPRQHQCNVHCSGIDKYSERYCNITHAVRLIFFKAYFSINLNLGVKCVSKMSQNK